MKEELDNLVSSVSTVINKAAENPLSAKKEGITLETANIQTEAAKDMLNTNHENHARNGKISCNFRHHSRPIRGWFLHLYAKV